MVSRVSQQLTAVAANDKGLENGETPVDPIYREILRPFGETMNVIMPYEKLFAITVNQTTPSPYWVQNKLTFRLNSINDCQVDAGAVVYAADPTASADTIGATVEYPAMRAYWANYYKYWTVTKTEYELEIVPVIGAYASATGSPSSSYSYMNWSVWTYHHGQQFPPFIEPVANIPVTDRIRGTYHKHCHRTVVHQADYNNYYQTFANKYTIPGKYTPGSIDNDVVEDEYQETWHKWDVVPKLREYVTFIVNPTDEMMFMRAQNSGTQVDFVCKMKIKYHVQLKDLVAKHTYPTNETDFSATTDPYAMV